MKIEFFVDGEPRAKQSFRSLGRRGGYTPAHIKAWQKDVALCAQGAMLRLKIPALMEGNLSVDLRFFLGNRRRTDLDNLSKAVLDALNGVVWIDDKQIINVSLRKYVCRECQGVLVQVFENHRPPEITRQQMKDMVGLAPFNLEPIYELETVSA